MVRKKKTEESEEEKVEPTPSEAPTAHIPQSEPPKTSREALVIHVTAKIKAAKKQRDADALQGIFETEEQKVKRLAQEAAELKAANEYV